MAIEGIDGRYVDIGLEGAALIIGLAVVVCFLLYYFLGRKIDRRIFYWQ